MAAGVALIDRSRLTYHIKTVIFSNLNVMCKRNGLSVHIVSHISRPTVNQSFSLKNKNMAAGVAPIDRSRLTDHINTFDFSDLIAMCEKNELTVKLNSQISILPARSDSSVLWKSTIPRFLGNESQSTNRSRPKIKIWLRE